jgi:hypothetical protein
MLIETDTGLIDVVVEAQFKDFNLGSQLCSVRSPNLESLNYMKNSVRGDINFHAEEKVFPYTGFAYLDDLARELKRKSIMRQVDFLDYDFSPRPEHYFYIAFEEPNKSGEDGQTWQGMIHAAEMNEYRSSVDPTFVYFRVWPMFNIS